YRSAGGAEVARLELALVPGTRVNVSDVAGGLELRVAGPSAAAPAPVAPRAVATTHIRDISVARGGDALTIAISGSGPMTARTLTLTHPDRVVVDIPNSVLQGRTRAIAVH